MFSEISYKKVLSLILIIVLALCLVSSINASVPETTVNKAVTEDFHMQGVWFSYDDYMTLGLSISDSEQNYRDKVDRIMEEVQKYRINTVFLHARVSDDAFWRSETFHASEYVGADTSLSAAQAYEVFDPFGVFLEEAHRYGMKVHAWINPYRISEEYYYDPGDDGTIERVLAAVRELLSLESNGEKVDGIHIDDYFYHGKTYYTVDNPSFQYDIVGAWEDIPWDREYHVVTPEEKREHVNRMVKEIHRIVSEAGLTFGISPQGNYDNDMKSGADIDTWLSEDGYIDYIIPQLYWTNQWGDDGKTTMFSDRLHLFLEKKKNHAQFYAGLGLYKTGKVKPSNDPGWKDKRTNLAEQIAELDSIGILGYAFFSAQYFFDDSAEEELANVKNYLDQE